MPSSCFSSRLLAEVIRLREEAGGHPAPSSAADHAAVEAGGDFMQRVRARAALISDADEIRMAGERVLRHSRWLLAGMLALSALGGVTAAATALGRDPVSLPLVLLLLVGANLLSLLMWLVLQSRPRNITPGSAALISDLWRWISARKAPGPTADVLRVLGGGALGRWGFSTAVHAAWLCYTGFGLLTLAALMSVRAYDLRWETTLLSAEQLARWAQWLSVGPRAIGVNGPASGAVSGAVDASARGSWAWWLLAAVLVYGLLPRLIALLLSAGLWWRAHAALGTDASLPGYARLRARLLPDHCPLGLGDAAAPPTEGPAAVVNRSPLPPGPLHAVALEWTPPVPPGQPDFIWLGSADSAASHAQLQQRLRAETVNGLVVVVRATATPDRGVERRLSELAAAAAAPALLVLGDVARLRARGEDAAGHRLEQWRQAAQRSGYGDTLAWDSGSALRLIGATSPT